MTRLRVKVCGVTTPDGVDVAVAAGADALGFVLAESPRRLDRDRARDLMDRVPPFVARVAVLHHPTPDEVAAAWSELRPDWLQAEPEGLVLPAGARLLPVFHDGPDLLAEVSRYRAERPGAAVLVEGAGRGGRGVAADWTRAAEVARAGPTVLAGGLTPDNVAEAVRRVRPFAVDVSSGVEPPDRSRPGVKDPARVRAFVAAARRG